MKKTSELDYSELCEDMQKLFSTFAEAGAAIAEIAKDDISLEVTLNDGSKIRINIERCKNE